MTPDFTSYIKPVSNVQGSPRQDFTIGIGSGGAGGGIALPGGTFNWGINPVAIIAPGAPRSGQVTPGSGGVNNGALTGGILSILNCTQNPTDCLLRILFFILGLLLIGGGIYLFKPTQVLVSNTVGKVKDAAAFAA